MSGVDPLDDICSDLHHLHHLLDIAVGLLMDVPRTDEIKHDLDRIGALLWVSRTMAETAGADVAAHPPVTT